MAGRSTVVCVSDGCLLPLLLAKAAAGVQLYSVESSPHSSNIVKEVRTPDYPSVRARQTT